MDGAVFSYDGDGLLRIGGEFDIAGYPGADVCRAALP
jgi:hypothetical protein